ncbi:hypothetical protein GGR57DRAFT_117617 [Xylariaceae sp. FL1272]|nr:hypothetical protein GGR57DRAFT_117617 [Xylariaceae sp. FL1272]
MATPCSPPNDILPSHLKAPFFLYILFAIAHNTYHASNHVVFSCFFVIQGFCFLLPPSFWHLNMLHAALLHAALLHGSIH